MFRKSRAFSWLLLVGMVGVVGSFVGCGLQKQGERCSLTNGNSDCENGGSSLFCTEAATLRGGTDKVDRCCPHPDIEPSDTRCAKRTVVDGGGGAGGAGGDNGAGGADDGDRDTEIGGSCDADSDCIVTLVCGSSKKCQEQACRYPSDCPTELVCGPTGVCQFECKSDRDCTAPLVCSKDQSCVTN